MQREVKPPPIMYSGKLPAIQEGVLEAADLFLDWLQNGTEKAINDVLEKHGLEPEFTLPPEEDY